MNERVASTTVPSGFRRDDADGGIPAAGVILLLLLGAALLCAWWWHARRHGGGGPRPAPWSLFAPTTPAADGRRAWAAFAPRGGASVLRTLGSHALGPGHRLHVVEWHGRQYLVATSAQGAPVVIDRLVDPPGGPTPDAPSAGTD